MIDSRARARRSSSLQSDDDTPTTGTSSGSEPSSTMWYTAGKSFFLAKSPVMPNRTSASLCGLPSSAIPSTTIGLPHHPGRMLRGGDDFVDDGVRVRETREEHL